MKTMWATAIALVAGAWGGCGGTPDDLTQQETQEVRGERGVEIAPPRSEPYGRSYGEWEAAWWQWALRIPRDRNPVADATGAHCAEGQSGPVWFLAGNEGGVTRRECTIPAGRALFFPVGNQIWVQTAQDDPHTIRELYDISREGVRGIVLSASIDGRAVEHLSRYYEETPVFRAVLPVPDNLWDMDATACPAGRRGTIVCAPSLDVGYALFLEPLPRGDHELHFAAAFTSGFSLDVTYTLHVR